MKTQTTSQCGRFGFGRTVALLLAAVLAMTCGRAAAASGAAGGRQRVAILRDASAGTDDAVVQAVSEALHRAAFEVVPLSAAAAADPATLTPDACFLYVISGVPVYPAAATNALVRYLQNKGNLLILGTPVFPGQPLLETVSPACKQFPLTGIASLKVCASQSVIPDVTLPAPAALSSCYTRPEGKGFERGYQWRWIPLARAYDASGAERGTPIWMLIHQKTLAEGPAFQDAVRRLVGKNTANARIAAEGSICAVCAVRDAAALKKIAKTEVLGKIARRISDGVFLSHAGSREFSYWPGEKVQLGAEAVNFGPATAACQVRVRVCPKGTSKPVFEKTAALIVKKGERSQSAFEWVPGLFKDTCYVVVCQLMRDGRVIDSITHEMGVLSTEKAKPGEFVSVRGNTFLLNGKRWSPVGVNYWPRSAIALEQEDYVYHWLTPGFYDPEEVEKDLCLLEAAGLNFVAIRAHHENDRRTVLDFLRRCRNHGIVAMVFLQSHVITDDPHYFQGIMTPFHYQTDAVRDFMRATRIADNPALLCWDLIWEPAGWVFGGKIGSFGWTDPAPYRQRWDARWAAWIDERYGSLVNAENDWGVPAPRKADGTVTSPSGKQLSSDGPWRVMVCAYRRFMADLMNRYWNDAAREIHSLDDHHLISYRQGNLPTCDFTLTSTLKHVDFFAMEGYDFKPGKPANAADVAGFVNSYIPYATGGKPFMWIEYGQSAWDGKSMTPSQVAYQGDCHELINRMAYQTGANGIAPWWMAGGYRISEKSDFGVFNPDGTLRPSGESLKKYAALIRTAPARVLPAEPFVIDCDSHSGGLPYLARHGGADAFAKASAQGKRLAVRSAGTGTTSANTPLTAVGDRPYNGSNPPQYLNAEFNAFSIRVDGKWVNVTDGARVAVPAGKAVVATASVGNLQEAEWLTPAACAGKPGAVFLASTPQSGLSFKRAVSRNTPFMQDAEFGDEFVLSRGIEREVAVELQMTAEGRARFGETFRFTLVPQ